MRALNSLGPYYDQQEKQFPQGQPFWVEVKATYAGTNLRSCPTQRWQFLHPDSTCVKVLEVRTIAQKERPGPDKIEGCTQTVYFRRIGKGGRVVDRPDVALSLSPTQLTVKPCQRIFFTANASFMVNGRKVNYDASQLGILWSVNKPQGLQKVSDDGHTSFLGAPGTQTLNYQAFRALKPGRYTIMARLLRVDPRILGGDPVVARMLADLSEVTFATAQVNVGEPTLSYIKIFGAGGVRPNGTIPLSARAFYEESCHMPDGLDVTSETGWSLTGGPGSLQGNVYQAPPLEPAPGSLQVLPRDKTVEACEDSPTYSAFIRLKSPKTPATIMASYGSKTDEASVKVINTTVDSDVSDQVAWDPGRSFEVGNEPKRITVKATFPNPLMEKETSLYVGEPEIEQVVIDPGKAELDMGASQQFTAWAHYKNDCREPGPLAADGVNWIMTGEHGSLTETGLFNATKPGAGTVFTYKAFAPSPEPASVTVRTPDLVIAPKAATLTVGQKQSFAANLQGYMDVTNNESLQWVPGPSNIFKAEACGNFPVKATYTDPETSTAQSDTATVQVKVDDSECEAIRNALQASASSDGSPDVSQWLQRRQNLIDKGCGNCGVEPTWTAGDTETKEVSSDGADEDGQGGCSDPRREVVPVASVSEGDTGGYRCGSCKDGFISYPTGDGKVECLTPDQLGPRISCPGGSVPDYDPAQGILGCFCPSKQPAWDGANQVCFAPPQQTVDLTPVVIGIIGAGIAAATRDRGPRRPPSSGPTRRPPSKCHRRPDGKGWDCGRN